MNCLITLLLCSVQSSHKLHYEASVCLSFCPIQASSKNESEKVPKSRIMCEYCKESHTGTAAETKFAKKLTNLTKFVRKNCQHVFLHITGMPNF